MFPVMNTRVLMMLSLFIREKLLLPHMRKPIMKIAMKKFVVLQLLNQIDLIYCKSFVKFLNAG